MHEPKTCIKEEAEGDEEEAAIDWKKREKEQKGNFCQSRSLVHPSIHLVFHHPFVVIVKREKEKKEWKREWMNEETFLPLFFRSPSSSSPSHSLALLWMRPHYWGHNSPTLGRRWILPSAHTCKYVCASVCTAVCPPLLHKRMFLEVTFYYVRTCL